MAAQTPAEPESGRRGASPEAIVILGGFMSLSAWYSAMRLALVQLTGQTVCVVATRSAHWIPSMVPAGWLYLLRKLDSTVRTAAKHTTSGRVTLIGHSAGGVLGRLYLSPKPFLGQEYRGLTRVSRLITLGSPHYNQRRWIHGGMMARWVDKRVPGACFAPQVQYCSVAGKLIRGDRQGSLRERHAYRFYDQIGGVGDAWGDGLVPIASALLAGSQQITLEGVGHFVGFGNPWYGTKESIAVWWQACQAVYDRPGASPPG
jgi:pimeloyl-ACP methyl ester carboxylesterase